jgi:hypothetical protein
MHSVRLAGQALRRTAAGLIGLVIVLGAIGASMEVTHARAPGSYHAAPWPPPWVTRSEAQAAHTGG